MAGSACSRGCSFCGRCEDGGDGPEPARATCATCRQSGDATWAVRHFDQTGHAVTIRGVIQCFSFEPSGVRSMAS